MLFFEIVVRHRHHQRSVTRDGFVPLHFTVRLHLTVTQVLAVGAARRPARVAGFGHARPVGVAVLDEDASLVDVVHTFEFIPAATAIVHALVIVLSAIDDLLLGEIEQLTRLLSDGRLDYSECAEGIARFAAHPALRVVFS